MSIRNRFLVAFLSLLAIVLLVGLWSLRQLETELETGIGENLAAVVRSTLDRLTQEIYARLEEIEILARTTPEIEALLRRSGAELDAFGTPAEITALIDARDAAWQSWQRDGEPLELMRAISGDPVSRLLTRKQTFLRRLHGRQVFAEIFLTDRHGVNVAQTAITSDYRQSDEGWWQEGKRDGIWLSPVVFDDSARTYSIDVVVRVGGDVTAGPDGDAGAADDGFLGVLKAVYDIAAVETLLADYATTVRGGGGTVELFDARGARLYPSYREPAPRERVPRATLKAESEAGENAGDALGELIRREVDDAGGEALWIETRAAAHPRYPDLGWRLRVSYPAAEVFAPIVDLRRRLLLAALLATLAAVAVALVVARQVARPLDEAVTVARRLARGELDFEIVAEGGGEAAALLAAMGQMLDNIRRTIGRMVGNARHTAAAAQHLSATARQIATGAERQTRASADSRASVDAMSVSTEQVSRAIAGVAAEVESTAAAITTMARSIATVATNAERQSATLEETFTRVHQLSASVAGVADDAASVGSATGAAVAEARAGGEAVRETAAGMGALAETIDEIVAVNARLAEKSRRISHVTEAIEGIAGQSGMLALNAAIQATKAGTRGHGFAVVAEEIGTLAERSAGSAQEIARLVEDLQQETGDATRITGVGAERARRGVELAERAARALRRIEETVIAVRETTDEIITRTREQASTAEAMRASFERMHRMTAEVTSETRTLRRERERIRSAVELLQRVTQETAPAIDRHHADGTRVGKAIEHIATISAQNAQTATEIVAATEDLKSDAQALRELADFFMLKRDC